MKKLYISDLDGTLLDKNAEIVDKEKQRLNCLIEQGLNFSVATARSAATVVKILEGIDINVPIVIMNGVCTFDLKKNEYVDILSIEQRAKRSLLDAINSGFVYCIDDNEQITYFQNTDSPNSEQFMNERIEKYQKKFQKVESFEECAEKNIVYYSVSDRKGNLIDLAERLGAVEGLHVEFYRDIYNDDYWYLEVVSDRASKYNAVMKIKEKFNFEYVVGFGDNLNDLPLFEACDEAYAVANAKPEVKQKATGVIENVIDYLQLQQSPS